jgi:hypothetical protein
MDEVTLLGWLFWAIVAAALIHVAEEYFGG